VIGNIGDHLLSYKFLKLQFVATLAVNQRSNVGHAVRSPNEILL
jgi:hypothetical protein